MGTGAAVPTPAALPSISAVMGPGESAVLGSLTLGQQTTAETEAAAAVDPNETGILATFANSAASTQAGVAANAAATLESVSTGAAASQFAMAQEAGGGGQGIANPLGPQVSYVPDYSTSTTTPAAASSGPSPVLILGALAIAGGGLWWFESHHHHQAKAAA